MDKYNLEDIDAGKAFKPLPAFRNKLFLWILTLYTISTVAIWLLFAFIAVMDDEPDSGFTQWYTNYAFEFWGIYNAIAIVIMLVSALLLVYYVNTMEFRLLDKEIIVKKGVINKTEKHVPFRNVTNIASRYGIYDRLFGIGTVEIETAGKSGQQTSAEATIEGIPNFFEVRDLILERLRKFRGQYATTTETVFTAPIASEEETRGFEKELLKELKDIKEILSK